MIQWSGSGIEALLDDKMSLKENKTVFWNDLRKWRNFKIYIYHGEVKIGLQVLSQIYIAKGR